MKRLIASAVVCFSVIVVASGDEITGIVTKFEDGKITITKKGEETTLRVAGDAKYLKAKINIDGGFSLEVEGDYEGGKDAFAKAVKVAAAKKQADAKKADDKKSDDKKGKFGIAIKGGLFGGGVFAQIVTEGEGDNAKVTEVRVIDISISAFKNFKKGSR